MTPDNPQRLNALIEEMRAGLDECPEWGANSGHGHVWKRPDGVRMRCGGPAMCADCARDLARSRAPEFNRDNIRLILDAASLLPLKEPERQGGAG